MAHSIKDYLSLPYTIEVLQDKNTENPGWVARVVELPGCLTQADTFAELEEMVQDAMRAWLETALADGITIPEPKADEQFSGKFVVRVPRSLHRKLVIIAEKEGVSLNQLISTTLAARVGEYYAIDSRIVQPEAHVHEEVSKNPFELQEKTPIQQFPVTMRYARMVVIEKKSKEYDEWLKGEEFYQELLKSKSQVADELYERLFTGKQP